jgi:O-methyltransferase domain
MSCAPPSSSARRVDAAARAILRDHGEERVEVITGDMFTDTLPTGFDLHLLSHVLHDWDESRVRRLLATSSQPYLRAAGWSITTRT